MFIEVHEDGREVIIVAEKVVAITAYQSTTGSTSKIDCDGGHVYYPDEEKNVLISMLRKARQEEIIVDDKVSIMGPELPVITPEDIECKL